MRAFSHANDIVLRRLNYIHSLPGVKLVKLFCLANETWCAVTVSPFDFVEAEFKVVALCKTTGKNLNWKKVRQYFVFRR